MIITKTPDFTAQNASQRMYDCAYIFVAQITRIHGIWYYNCSKTKQTIVNATYFTQNTSHMFLTAHWYFPRNSKLSFHMPLPRYIIHTHTNKRTQICTGFILFWYHITRVSFVCSTFCSGVDQIKKGRHWSWWGETTGDWWVPLTKASKAKNVSIWWRCHGLFYNNGDICYYINPIYTRSIVFNDMLWDDIWWDWCFQWFFQIETVGNNCLKYYALYIKHDFYPMVHQCNMYIFTRRDDLLKALYTYFIVLSFVIRTCRLCVGG